jgi:hypothetical protein
MQAMFWWGQGVHTRVQGLPLSQTLCTRLSALRKFPQRGQHPLPQVNKLTNLLLAFSQVDEAQRHLKVKWDSFRVCEVPACPHPNTFWFPENGPIFMDTLKNACFLTTIPKFKLCSDCGALVDHTPVPPNLEPRYPYNSEPSLRS